MSHGMEMCFGKEVSKLALRMGIHSGSCKASVMQLGGTARFKLCGDTVKIAALMQSTSEKGYIQISSTTAQHLADLGNENWYKQRNEGLVGVSNDDYKGSYWLTKPKVVGNEDPSGLDIEFSSDTDEGVDSLEDITAHFEESGIDRVVD